MARTLKWVGGIVGVYIVFVVIFESVYLGHFQPSFEEGGIPMLDKRRVARLQSSSGPMYVSAHHWTRGWYHELVANPKVHIEIDGVTTNYVAVVVTGDEFDRIAAEFPLPLLVRFLMGFPPERDIVRLDPVSS
jgi:hypothetical protein